MNIHFTWVKEKAVNEIDIFAHPENKQQLLQLEKQFQQEKALIAIDPKTIVPSNCP